LLVPEAAILPQRYEISQYAGFSRFARLLVGRRHTVPAVAITVQPVTASATRPLRRRVLRPHQTLDELATEDALRREAAYFAAVEGGEVVGVASLDREPAPWSPHDPTAWRLRQMATAESHRGRGIGSAVLQSVIGHVRERGGGLLWCTARTPAIAFYERAQFEVRGQRWVDPVLGPHVAMHRFVPSS
jgi:GNAT superfamily N-acetyltransferase